LVSVAALNKEQLAAVAKIKPPIIARGAISEVTLFLTAYGLFCPIGRILRQFRKNPASVNLNGRHFLGQWRNYIRQGFSPTASWLSSLRPMGAGRGM
jgi:hypothetical protein